MGDMDSRITSLWVAVGEARALSADVEVPPWESTIPSVKKSWDELTHPSNLGDLRAWAAHPEEMNPFAREASLRAIQDCEFRTHDLERVADE